MAEKKIPLRKCTGCGEMKSKKEMVRVIRTAEGEILMDLTGRKNGRGAYICGRAECLRLARKSRALERALQTAIDAEVFAQLEAQIGPETAPDEA